MSIIDELLARRDALAGDPDRWVGGYPNHGEQCLIVDNRGVDGRYGRAVSNRTLEFLYDRLAPSGPGYFNNCHSQPVVLAKLDDLIAYAKDHGL